MPHTHTMAAAGVPQKTPSGRATRPAGWVAILVDVVIVLVLVLASGPAIYDENILGTDLWPVVFTLGLALPLLLRRRAPFIVFGVVVAVMATQWFTNSKVLPADLAVLVAFYTAVATSTRSRAIFATTALGITAVLSVVGYGYVPGFFGLPIFLLFLAGLATSTGMFRANVRVRKAYLAEVEQRVARLEFERDQQGQLATAAERTRIAREMHDIIAHNLSVVIALSDGASYTLDDDPQRAAAAMRETSAAGRRALRELRRVLGVLRDDEETATLTPAPTIADLDHLVGAVERTGLRAPFTSEGSTERVGSSLQTTVYRLVQEALTNTVKHATDASEVAVTLRCERDHVEVAIVDNAAVAANSVRSADTTADGAAGHGILGMRERVAMHGGKLDIGPTPTGWAVRARFPLGPIAAEQAPAAQASDGDVPA